MTALVTAGLLVILALLIPAAAVVFVLWDRRQVRETNALIEQLRAGETPVLDDAIGDDIVAMTKAWQDEVNRP